MLNLLQSTVTGRLSELAVPALAQGVQSFLNCQHFTKTVQSDGYQQVRGISNLGESLNEQDDKAGRPTTPWVRQVSTVWSGGILDDENHPTTDGEFIACVWWCSLPWLCSELQVPMALKSCRFSILDVFPAIAIMRGTRLGIEFQYQHLHACDMLVSTCKYINYDGASL